MRIGGLFIGWPHRRTWKDGVCFEWGDLGFKPPYKPNVGFVRIYIQRRRKQ